MELTVLQLAPRGSATYPAFFSGACANWLWPAPRLAPPYKISVALLRSVTSCFGCSTNVNESFLLIAAALDEDLGLEVDVGAALNIVAHVIAIFLWCQSSRRPLARINPQASHIAILLRCRVCDLNTFFEEFVRLRLARARVSLKKVLVLCSASGKARHKLTSPGATPSIRLRSADWRPPALSSTARSSPGEALGSALRAALTRGLPCVCTGASDAAPAQQRGRHNEYP